MSTKKQPEEMITVSQAIETVNIYDALARCQAEFPPIPRDQTAKLKGVSKKTDKEYDFGYSYTSLAKLQETTRPILAKYGLCIFQTLVEVDGKLKLQTTLASIHNDGQIIDQHPIREIPDPQQFGSLLTYARRYSWERILGVSGMDDDDGVLAKTATPPRGSQQTPKPATKTQGDPQDFPSTPKQMLAFWNDRNPDRVFSATAHMWNALKGDDPDFNWPRGQDIDGWRDVYKRLTANKKSKLQTQDPDDGDQETLPGMQPPERTGYENE